MIGEMYWRNIDDNNNNNIEKRKKHFFAYEIKITIFITVFILQLMKI